MKKNLLNTHVAPQHGRYQEIFQVEAQFSDNFFSIFFCKKKSFKDHFCKILDFVDEIRGIQYKPKMKVTDFSPADEKKWQKDFAVFRRVRLNSGVFYER